MTKPVHVVCIRHQLARTPSWLEAVAFWRNGSCISMNNSTVLSSISLLTAYVLLQV